MKIRLRNLLILGLFMAFSNPFLAYGSPVLPQLESAEEVSNLPLGGAYLVFGGKLGGEIDKKTLAKQTELGVSGCAAGSKIFQFTLYVTQNGKTKSYKASDCLLSDEICNVLRGLSKGDSFQFKKIKARLPNGDGIVDVFAKKFTVV